MHIYKVLPDFKKPKQLGLWHKALKSQWAPDDAVDWDLPKRSGRDKLIDQLARIMTPLIMGEQAALYSVTEIIQILGQEQAIEGQFYLASMAVDEARHTEMFARVYHRLETQPLSIRRFESGYLFQSAIMSKDPSEWLTGSLISEVVAKHTLEELRRVDVEPVLTQVCNKILEDEARHLAFNHVFLEDRSYEMFVKDGKSADEWAHHLRERLAHVLDTVGPILRDLGDDLKAVGIDPDDLGQRTIEDATRRLDKSLDSGRKRATTELEVSSSPA